MIDVLKPEIIENLIKEHPRDNKDWSLFYLRRFIQVVQPELKNIGLDPLVIYANTIKNDKRYIEIDIHRNSV